MCVCMCVCVCVCARSRAHLSTSRPLASPQMARQRDAAVATAHKYTAENERLRESIRLLEGHVSDREDALQAKERALLQLRAENRTLDNFRCVDVCVRVCVCACVCVSVRVCELWLWSCHSDCARAQTRAGQPHSHHDAGEGARRGPH